LYETSSKKTLWEGQEGGGEPKRKGARKDKLARGVIFDGSAVLPVRENLGLI